MTKAVTDDMHVQSYLSDGGVDVLFVCTHSASIGVVFFHNQRAAELRARNAQLPLFEVHLDCVTKPPVML